MEKIVSLYRKNKEIINYLIFGVLTTVVNIVVFALCAEVFHIQYLIANVLAWIMSVIFAYVTNRKYVFESKSEDIGKEVTKFFSSRLSTLALDMIVMWLLVDILTASNLIAKVLANILVIIANYILSKVFVFKEGGRQ
ncbi:GtrA family protein [uncultured Dubosiella sp.]|uniref:GtrA family protein n=1 Tax=uncultured Dubosiella sp. TaxID=1937011 RepID=UPI0032B1A724